MPNPNAFQREQRIQERRIRALSESAQSRAQTTKDVGKTVSVGAVDSSGSFVLYGRLDVDALSLFRLAE